MQFSESNSAWQAIPHWALFAIRLGYVWPTCWPSNRRICLISMPCDSAAAGLVALGAMRRRLECDDANELASHFQRLVALVGFGNKTFLFYPKETKPKARGPYVVDCLDPSGMLWVKLASSPDVRRTISPATANDWKIQGDPPVQVLAGDQIPYGDLYSCLVENGDAIKVSNLARSDSGICLAGRVTGETSSKGILAGVRFKTESSTVDLSQLLTIQSWSPGKASRVSFLNTRIGEFDRNPNQPRVVVVDGDAAFLKVIDKDEFHQTDIIAVFHRAIERDRLEAIGAKLVVLGQWYDNDIELLSSLAAPPRDVTLSILQRR